MSEPHAHATGIEAGIGDELEADIDDEAARARRLDVLSVVDAVCAGLPAAQVGGLVAAARHAGRDRAATTAYVAQHLVSSLQALHTLIASLRVVAGLSAALGPTPPTVTTSGPAGIVATPSATPMAGGRSTPVSEGPWWRTGPGVQVTLVRDRRSAPGPSIPYEADLSVRSVATAPVVATAPLPADAILNAGRGFSFALLTGTGSDRTVTSVEVAPRSRLRTVAAAINATDAPVVARVEHSGSDIEPEERLVLTSTRAGAQASIAVVEGVGSRRPSALGAAARHVAGADSVIEAAFGDGAVFLVTAATTSLTRALPGVDIALLPARDELDRIVRISVQPDPPAALHRLSTLVCAASAVLEALAGRGPINPASATVLADDPEIDDLRTRIVQALGCGGELAEQTSIPGVRTREDRRFQVDRVQVDDQDFVRAYATDSARVEAAVQRAARSLADIAGEATDLASGFLPERIARESVFVHGRLGARPIDDRLPNRRGALADRVEAMKRLLDNCDAERTWLNAQLELLGVGRRPPGSAR